MDTTKSKHAFKLASECIPGGVNSPIRAFRAIGRQPLFIKGAKGARIFDVDNNEYLDYVLSYGPLILGHAHPGVVDAICTTAANGTSFGACTPLEYELADLIIQTVPSVEMLRFVNSGTEATMTAIRLARGVTKRDKIIKFSGNYHGHADALLAEAGSGVASEGIVGTPGVPKCAVQNTIVLPYNDIESVKTAFEIHKKEIAAVIVEPVAGNMGFVLPKPDFLPELQTICGQNGSLFILDEVMTGFRVALGGAQDIWSLDPDITCLGKVIGGGLPVGAIGGKKEIMKHLSPLGEVFQAGTLSGNPLAMAAGIATLRTLRVKGYFEAIEKRTETLVRGLKSLAITYGVPIQANYLGTMFGFYFLTHELGNKIDSFESANNFMNKTRYSQFANHMLDNGVFFAPSPYEAGFMSSAHKDEDIEETLTHCETFFKAVS